MWTIFKTEQNCKNIINSETLITPNKKFPLFGTAINKYLINEIDNFIINYDLMIIDLSIKTTNTPLKNLQINIEAMKQTDSDEDFILTLTKSTYHGEAINTINNYSKQSTIIDLTAFKEAFDKNKVKSFALSQFYVSNIVQINSLDLIFLNKEDIYPLYHQLKIINKNNTTLSISDDAYCQLSPNVYFNNTLLYDKYEDFIIEDNTSIVSWYQRDLNINTTSYFSTPGLGWKKVVYTGEKPAVDLKLKRPNTFLNLEQGIETSHFCEQEYICSVKNKSNGGILISEPFTITNVQNCNKYNFEIKLQEKTRNGQEYSAILSLDGQYEFNDEKVDSISYKVEWYYYDDDEKVFKLINQSQTLVDDSNINSPTYTGNSSLTCDVTSLVVFQQKTFQFVCAVYLTREVLNESTNKWETDENANNVFVCYRDYIFEKSIQNNEFQVYFDNYLQILKNLPSYGNLVSNLKSIQENYLEVKDLYNTAEVGEEKQKYYNQMNLINSNCLNQYGFDCNQIDFYLNNIFNKSYINSEDLQDGYLWAQSSLYIDYNASCQDFITIEEMYYILYKYAIKKFRDQDDNRLLICLDKLIQEMASYYNDLYLQPYDMTGSNMSVGQTRPESILFNLNHNCFEPKQDWVPGYRTTGMAGFVTVEDCIHAFYQGLIKDQGENN